jgi:AraC-like DNA-binding protein
LGRSPGAEILRVRIEQAKNLLAETDLTIEVISRRTGFRKPAYFSTAFGNQTGSAPSMYRRLAGPRGSSSADECADLVPPPSPAVNRRMKDDGGRIKQISIS